MAEQVPCRIQVGESAQEFWIASDLLDAPASRNNDARQDVVMRRFATQFGLAYSNEAIRRRGDLGAKADDNA